MKKICCIGHITRDRIITPQQTIDMAGGTSFYMAHGMHHLSQDFPFQLVTKIGQESQEEVDHLRQMNIDVLSYSSPHSVFFENTAIRAHIAYFLKIIMALIPINVRSVYWPKQPLLR